MYWVFFNNCIGLNSMGNKIQTPGYIIKRLRDAGFVVWKCFNCYADGDTRKWTILIDPGNASVYLTCFQNKELISGICYHLDDGGQRFSEHTFLKTESAEVIIKALVDAGVNTNPKNNKFFKDNVNN